MCKILTLTNISKIKNIDRLITSAAETLAQYEDDGFGYSILGKKGLYGERTTFPETFVSSIGRKEFKTQFSSPVHNVFGVKSKAIGPAMFHGRTSTNDHTLINTHPINKNDWSLIHNGVVTNHGPKYKMITTNDTEHCLEYLSTVGISGIEKNLTGYYAITAIDPMGRLHVIKDSRADLFVTYVDSIESFIFATNSDIIESVCKDMEWTPNIIQKVTNNTYITFALTEVESVVKINPRGETREELQYASKSLGYEVKDYVSPYAPEHEESDEGEFMSSEDKFLSEIYQYADKTYLYQDMKGNDIDYNVFMNLEDDEKLQCIVIRPDGTICDQWNYDSESRYGA